jgi:hypothetical protein
LQVKAHALYGSKEKAKDPFFGLTMGKGSQSSDDVFRRVNYISFLPYEKDVNTAKIS